MSFATDVIFTILYAITLIASLVGNTLLIYIVWKKPEVRSLTSFMFVNMAVADLLVTLFVIPYSVMDLYTAWPMSGLLGNIVCKTAMYIAYFTMTTSFLCLTFMALDRFYAVVYPFQRLLWFRKPKVLIPIVWILPMALMSIVPVYIVFFPEPSRCGIDIAILGGDMKKILAGIYSYFFTVHYLLPLSVNTTLYTITAFKLWFHAVPGDTLAQNPQQQQLTKKKVVRMLIIVSTTFAVCWLPGQVYHLYIAITSNTNEFVGHICFWFGYNNSAINPWLYIGLNSKMYSAFSRMVGREARLGKNGLIKESKEVTPNQDVRV